MKLFKPTESNMLFDGASLVLYMIGVVIYIANIVKGLRLISEGYYGGELAEGEIGGPQPGQEAPLGKDESLKVMSASNTILALVLLGVLVLQAGQWYAERKQGQEMEAAEKERESRKGAVGDKHRNSAGKKKS